MIHCYKVSIICFLLSITNTTVVLGQAISVSTGVGKVIKHKEELLFGIPPISSMTRVSYISTLDGSKDWHHYWGMPEIDYSLMAVAFGDNQVLGHAVALTTGIQYDIVNKNKFSWTLGGRSGIAYLTKVYNRIDNTDNNAISSHINNATNLHSTLTWKLTNNWSMSQDLDLLHFSNGRTKSPNSGINVWAASVSISRRLATRKIQIDRVLNTVPTRSLGLLLQSGLGKSQYRNLAGGPTYRVFNIDALAYWQFAMHQRMILGVGYEHNDALYAYNLQIFTPDNLASKAARDISIMLGDELQFGSLSYRFLLGYYLNIPSEHIGEPVYFKIGAWYFSEYLKFNNIQPYIGLQMKTHFAIAESLSLYVGVKF